MQTELPDDLAEIFEYLDALRRTGEMNMYGAGAYLQRDFGYDRRTADAALSAWMATFSNEISPADRAAKAIAEQPA